MKKIIFTALCILATFSIQAQTVTQQSLQGTWNLVYLEANGISMDMVNKTYTISEDLREEYGEMIQDIEGQIKELMEKDFNGQMVFDKNTMTESHTDENERVTNKGTFKLLEGTPVKMECSMENSEEVALEVYFKDGNLEMHQVNDNTKAIYKKAK